MLARTERPNIKDFALETPALRRDLPFEPGRDISQAMWDKLNEIINFYLDQTRNRLPHDAVSLLAMAADMSILKTKNRRLNFNFGPDEWRVIDSDIFDIQNDRSKTSLYFQHLKNIHIIDPNRAKSDKYKLPANALARALYDQKPNEEEIAYNLASLKIVDPAFSIEVPEKLWEKLKSYVKGIVPSDPPPFFGALITQYIGNLKILNPDKTREITQGIAYPWDEMIHTLQAKKINDRDVYPVEDYLLTGRRMALLAATEIKVTENGVELIMSKREKDLNDRKPLPELRRF